MELDLEKAGELPEIFYANNIRSLRNLETHTWWLTRAFPLPENAGNAPWELVFEGLDTLATEWINGVQVGQSANMLVEQRFDASAALKTGEENTIAVRLASPLNAARLHQYDAVTMSWELREEGLHIHKAAHMWGWDHSAVDRDRIRLMANQVKELFGAIPESLEDFSLASQVTQAEAVKFFIRSAFPGEGIRPPGYAGG